MKLNKKQQGFAMLEVVLAIVIIAIASFGVYKLYSSSSMSSKLSSEEDLVSQIYNQATQMASLNNGTQPTAEQLFNSGAFSTDDYPASDGIFKGQFGDVVYEGKDSYSSITAKRIPGSVVDQFAGHMKSWGDVYTEKSNGGSETAYPDTSGYSADELYTVILYFPQGVKTDSGS